ncbi:MAG: hypothetical protein IPJ06_01965 [Saprospiraceae bacterium]|nr:hypothetical protein [Saprospiraceae bacterium]
MINYRSFLMRAGLVALLSSFCIDTLPAQRQDNHWIFGAGSSLTNEKYGINQIDFFSDTPTVKLVQELIAAQPSAQTISTATGQLLLFSNGCRIYNNEFAPQQAPNPAISGIIGESYCDSSTSYPSSTGYLFLSLNDTFVYHVYKEIVLIPGKGYGTGNYRADAFSCTSGVCNLRKTQDITNQSSQQYYKYLAAVRHGNGRDWWLVSPGVENNSYHRALVTPTGITDMGWSSIGIPFGPDAYGGNMTFSRNGEMMARSDGFNGIHLYGFDRCTGEFTWYKRLAVFSLGQVESAFCGFSNNDRFLYVAYGGKLGNKDGSVIYQLNLEKSDPWMSRIRVGEITENNCYAGNSVYGPFVNGPDGKLYNFVYSFCDLLHVIHQPDSLGMACQVENDAIRTPALYRLNMPIFPNFRLGRSIGSFCDTIYRDQHAYTLKAFPNPAQIRLL